MSTSGEGFSADGDRTLPPLYSSTLSSNATSKDNSSVPRGRVPPHNLEAERSVLGAILVQNDAIHRVVELGLEARDFCRDAHQKIFEVLMALPERGEPVDLVTLASAL